MTNTIKTMGLPKLVIKLHELRIQSADTPENENLIEEIATTETAILREIPSLYNKITDNILREAISELIGAEEDVVEAVTNLNDIGSEATSEEYEQLLKKATFTGDRLAQAWNDFLVEYEGYCEDLISGTPRRFQ